MCIACVCIHIHVASTAPQASNKLEQIQHRLMNFDEQWPPLRRWYQRFRNVGTINSNLDTEEVYSSVQDKIQEIINKVNNRIHVYVYSVHVYRVVQIHHNL